MAQPTIQTSFASGEWAPRLRSRVDIQKYRTGTALMRNFFVDWSGGGASTRQGTRFIQQARSNGARLIPFQPSANISYVLEFGAGYLRFYSNGAPIFEATTAISGATNANPGVITDTAHGYSNGDWIFIAGVGGMVQLNNQYYIVQNVTANTFTLTDLNGNAINTTTFGAYTSGGTAQRIYTIGSPYAVADLFFNPITGNPGLKYTQDVTSMILTHPNYPPQILTINAPTNWTLTAITFGTTIGTPTGLTSSTTLVAAASNWNYAYEVTAVDINGQESTPTAPTLLTGFKSLSDTSAPGTNLVSWTAVSGAQSYNVYKATPTFNTAIPTGTIYGFIGNTTGTSFTDPTPSIAPDFAQTPPIGENPFIPGSPVIGYTVTTPGTYTTVPGVTDAAPPAGGVQATAQASLGVTVATINSHGTSNHDMFFANGSPNPTGSLLSFANGVLLTITSSTFQGNIGGPFGDVWSVNSVSVQTAGSITSGSTPSNPIAPAGCNAVGFNHFSLSPPLNFNFTWGVTQVVPIQQGAGYLSPPSVTFSAGAAAATSILGPANAGNPGVSTFFQERLVFGAQAKNVQNFNMSQPGSFFNFNTSFPLQADDAISGQIIADDLNAIRSFTNVPTGLITMTNKSAWLLNGGGLFASQSPVTPTSIVASQQAFNGANDLRPLKINQDILYNTYKGNYVRDLTYNVYANIFTGQDITTLSNHLFTGFYLVDWCWAEEPYKIAWGVRNDGVMLSLSYVKEQELIGWAHHDTDGAFLSICSVAEQFSGDTVDAVYCIVRRLVGGIYVQYIERFADRFFFYGKEDAWNVDCGLQTAPSSSPTTLLTFSGDASAIGNTVTLTDPLGSFSSGQVVRVGGGVYNVTGSGTSASATVANVPENIDLYTGVPNPVQGYSIWTKVTSVSGLTQLNGKQVVGVADGVVVGPFTVSAGAVTGLPSSSKITLGLPFTPQLQTLALDLGEPTVQSKRKKLPALTMRVSETLGLQVGTSFSNLVTFKDFQLNAIPTQSNGVALVTDLVAGDGRQILDQVWQEPGQLCVQQNLPYPATILGIMPEVVVGDSPEPGGRRG